jgi:uncharacterized protein (TIGR02231 family)
MLMKWVVFFPTLIAVLLSGVSQAADELPVRSTISAVTVFPDRALVTRRCEFSIFGGERTILVEGLPADLIESSLRAEGEGDVDFSINSVENRRVFREELIHEEEQRLVQTLTGLQDERRILDDRIKVLNMQLEFIRAIGKNMPQTANEEIIRGEMAPQAWEQAWVALGDGATVALNGIRKTEIEQRSLQDRIGRVEKELAQIRTGRRENMEARINIQSSRKGNVRLHLRYLVPGASWVPMYDARLNSEEARADITSLGQVRQNTGEDWSGAELTLSSSRPAEGVHIMELEPWFIDFLQAGPLGEMRKAMPRERMKKEAKGFMTGADEEAAHPPVMAAAPHRQADILATEYAAEYRIPGSSSVPSDNTPHRFVLKEQVFDVDLTVRTVPKMAAKAYLYARGTYQGDAPLLPGAVSFFRDGSFVGTGGLNLLQPGEELRLSFGIDDKVRIDYRLEAGERSKEGIFNRQRRVERLYRIEVENYHNRPMEITVLDQLPVTRDERIKVELLDDSSRPTEQDVNGRKGVMAWTYTMAAKEKRVTKFGYAVSYPEGEVVPGF